jgi:hypothetical protein
MHDAEMPGAQRAQQFRQRPRGRRLNVVQHQYAPAFAFDSRQHARGNLVSRDMLPVVAFEIGAPSHDAVRCEMLLERRRAAQARGPVERRDRFAVAQGGHDKFNAAFEIPFNGGRRRLAENVMMLLMGCDGVAFRMRAAHQVRVSLGHAADDKECRLYAFGPQRVQNPRGGGRQRAIVEREDDFVVAQRQGVRVLHRADATDLRRIDGQHPARAERGGAAATIRCHGRCRGAKSASEQAKASRRCMAGWAGVNGGKGDSGGEDPYGL